jgi:hypothetical protein
MRAIRNNNRKTQAKQSKNRSISCEKISSKVFKDKFFRNMNLRIKDDFVDPMDNFPDFYDLKEKMFHNFRNNFGLLLDEEKEEKEPKIKNNKNKKINNGTYFSKVYCSSYNNVNGKEYQEKYQSQKINQVNNGHNISECKEAYKNSDGICKSSYQRGLDKKGERLIKEKNEKTGVDNEHKIFKGMKENEINVFNKEYNDYSKKYGFGKSCQYLNSLESTKKNSKKLITGETQTLNKKTRRH